jgi:hypothetical protein
MENEQQATTSDQTHKRFRTQRVKRKPQETNIVTVDPGISCVHCCALYDHLVTNTYPNGNRRLICSKCGRPFVTKRKLAQ